MAPASSESARPCGCDPAAEHVCEDHGKARDDSETPFRGLGFDMGGLSASMFTVTGPDEDGQFAIDIGTEATVYVDRFTFEAFIDECKRRVELRG